MNTALNEFCDDLGADGDRLREFIRALEAAAASNGNDRALLAAIRWVVKQPPTVPEKAKALAELFSLPRGHVFIPSAAQFFGWTEEEGADQVVARN
jgi:alkanesulfonate monooxygenase SsuD/methylene tetrahydromethanopterin reductase-like flavin-dependent oxidoreductase (luciferase family)